MFVEGIPPIYPSRLVTLPFLLDKSNYYNTSFVIIIILLPITSNKKYSTSPCVLYFYSFLRYILYISNQLKKFKEVTK